MADLIDRQAVLDLITASINQFGGRYTTEQLNMWGLFVQIINNDLPSVDAVEVVRCKDCEYYEEINQPYPQMYCRKHSIDPLDDDFCSRAERRKGG